MHRPGLCFQRIQPSDDQADRHHEIRTRRLEADRARLDFFHRHFCSRRLRGAVRTLGRGRRAAPRDVRRGAVLRRRLPGQRARRMVASPLDRLSRLRRARRDWAGARLHLSRLHADEMVSGSARHGHRHGDHGLWRRRHDRLAAFGLADERLLDANARRGRQNLRCHGARLRVLHARRRGNCTRAARRLAARGLCGSGHSQEARHVQGRLCLSGAEHPAVLADLDCSLHERHGGDRRARAGVGDEFRRCFRAG